MVKNKKGIMIILLLVLLLAFFVFKLVDPFYVDDGENRIYDEANLLTEDEKNLLSKKANKYSQKRDMDIYIYTSNEAYDGDVQNFANDFYDKIDSGQYRDGVLITLNMKTRYINISGYNKGSKYMDSSRASRLREYISSDFTSGNYYRGFDKYLDKTYKYLGVRPGANPDSIFLNNIVLLAMSLLAGGFGVGAMLGEVRGSKRSGINYRDANTSRIIDKKDTYLTTNVTRTRIIRNDSGPRGGSGGSFGGGGSSSGTTSGGNTYSGSSGKF